MQNFVLIRTNHQFSGIQGVQHYFVLSLHVCILLISIFNTENRNCKAYIFLKIFLVALTWLRLLLLRFKV